MQTGGADQSRFVRAFNYWLDPFTTESKKNLSCRRSQGVAVSPQQRCAVHPVATLETAEGLTEDAKRRLEKCLKPVTDA